MTVTPANPARRNDRDGWTTLVVGRSTTTCEPRSEPFACNAWAFSSNETLDVVYLVADLLFDVEFGRHGFHGLPQRLSGRFDIGLYLIHACFGAGFGIAWLSVGHGGPLSPRRCLA